jgi:hypothetical protein
MSKEIFDYLIIGDGIAARSFLYLLDQRLENQDANIGVISSDAFAPSCSKNSTSIVCLYGIRPNVSETGDLICKTHNYSVSNIYSKNIFKGARKCRRFVADCTVKDISRRFENYEVNARIEDLDIEVPFLKTLDSYLINNLVFHDSIYKNLRTKFQIFNKFIKYISSSDEGHIVHASSGEKYTAKAVINFTSGYPTITGGPDVIREHMGLSKHAYGDLIYFDNVNLGTKQNDDWILSLDEDNLIYRHDNSSLLFGSTTRNNNLFVPSIVELEQKYQTLCSKLKISDKVPDFKTGLIKTGVRHKGKKRRPFWGRIKPGLYSGHSYYKNAYTFSFYGSNEIINCLEEDLLI